MLVKCGRPQVFEPSSCEITGVIQILDVLWETPFNRELVTCEQICSSGNTSNTYLECDQSDSQLGNQVV